MKLLTSELSDKKITVLEYAVIIITAVIPLFFQHPYRINLFLAWEGAFRVSQGEIPYRDFGSPVGYGFWLLPALFFRIFGPYVYTLLVVQAFINIISGLTFRALVKTFHIAPAARWMAVLVFCLSYSMFNFWPWYNHLVFVFEIIGFYFLFRELLKPAAGRKWYGLATAAFFVGLAFMTKQDTGALGFLISLGAVALDWLVERSWKTVGIYVGAYGLVMALLILPFVPYDFGYWFNLGQFPHNARVDKFDIVNEFLGGSDFIKLYLVVVVLIVLGTAQWGMDWLRNERRFVFFSWLVLAILGQATIIQVTSYTPIDGNIYFHSFAVVFILAFFGRYIPLSRTTTVTVLSVLIVMWWSGIFWSRFLKEKVEKFMVDKGTDQEHVISKRTYLLSQDSTKRGNSRSKWVVSDIPSFRRIRIPEGTAQGIHQLMAMPECQKPGYKLLNMSELTPLAYDMGYTLERGAQYPLWFHKGVAFFDREVKMFCDRVSQKEYDVILFEDIPNVNQFYPYEVRDCMLEHYTLRFKFLAPRIPEISYIEVYTRKP